jgi:MFS family permease
VLTVLTGWLFLAGVLSAVWITVAWTVIFFFASAGASSGYLTASETFPMEIRAMVIAFVYAVGTAIGGVTGPLLYSALISGGSPERLFLGYCVGAGVMLAAGIIHRLLGVEAGGKSLEDVAAPLSAEEAAESPESPGSAGSRERAASTDSTEGTGEPDQALEEEIEILVRALAEDGPTDRSGLSRRVRARFWGPGRFRRAVRVAVERGRVRRAGRSLTVPDSEREKLGTGGR